MRYPRETVEFIPVTVTVDGVTVTTGVEFSVVAYGERPGTWAAPTVLGGAIGVMTDSQDPGTYSVWAKVTDSPETVVIYCGSYKVD